MAKQNRPSGNLGGKSYSDLINERGDLVDKGRQMFKQKMKNKKAGIVDEKLNSDYKKNSQKIDKYDAEISKRKEQENIKGSATSSENARERFAQTSSSNYERARSSRLDQVARIMGFSDLREKEKQYDRKKR